MKKLVSLAVGLLIAALFCFFTAALAQEPAVAPSPAGTVKKEPAAPVPDQPGIPYKRVRVIKGGNLALIAEYCGYTQADWGPLVNANTQLPKVEKIGEMWRVWIQPGQILNLPPGWSYKTLDPEYVVPYPPALKEARGPEGTTPLMPPEEPQKVVGTDSNRSLWRMPSWLPGLLVILAVVLVVLWLAGVFRSLPPIILSRRRNPRRYPAVVSGGLSDDPTTALAQVAAVYSGRTVATRRMVRGYFVKVDDSAPNKVLVRMAFRDGVEGPVYLRPGDSVYQAILEDGTVEGHYLQACGNAISRFQKPNGWRFVVGAAADIPRPTPPVFSAESEPAPVPAPESAPALEPEPTTATALAESPTPAEEPHATEEAPIAEAEETAKQTLTSNEVEITIGDLLIKVATGNGHIPATKIRTGDGVTVTLQQP